METFIARQPIFDKNQDVYAYELLFRSGMDNFFNHSDIDQASSNVIGNSVLIHDLNVLTSGKKAFYNMTRETLVNEYGAILPKDLAVVEILENVEPDPDVLKACRNLKEAGYPIALDDFIYDEKFEPFLELADIVKVDFLLSDKSERQKMAEHFIPRGIRMLAEKVETWEEFQEAKEMGYDYFQGYFFSKPVIVTGKEIPGFKLHYLQILQEIQRPELSYQGLEEIIKKEMSLSYKLLRYINSAFFGWHVEISSINHALVLLGETQVRKWTSLVAMASMAESKTDELVVQAILRAKFCELLAPRLGLSARSQDLFLMGMFSLIDGIMDLPLPEVIEKIPIAEDIKDALLGGEGHLGDIYQYMLAYAQGEWERIPALNKKLGLDDEGISELYITALDWSNQSFQAAA